MVYNDAMVERTLQLLRNEYRQDELDTLVNRYFMNIYTRKSPPRNITTLEADVLNKIVNDSIIKVRHIRDSLNKTRDKKMHSGFYNEIDAAVFLNWHKTERFDHLADSLTIARRESIRNRYLNDTIFNMRQLIESCGWVGDERFIKPLIEFAEQSKIESLKTAAIQKIQRLKVKP
jgi:hypothetical protein